MERMKIAICMEDGEYLKRLSACLLRYYRSCMEIHIFTKTEQMEKISPEEYEVFLIGDFEPDMPEFRKLPKEKILYLGEENTKMPEDSGITVLNRYEEVPRIVDAMGILAGKQENSFETKGEKSSRYKFYGIYSLNAAKLQLPFVILLANTLAEKTRVLVVDLQESSGLGGLKELEKEDVCSGMEDVMTMADSGKYTRARLISAIRHYRQWDYIYPVRNSEVLSEGNYSLYLSMLQTIEQEMNYGAVIINFGGRFPGFFRLISDCKQCFLLGDGN